MPDLVGHDRRPSAFVVYLFLTGLSARTRRPDLRLSYREIGVETGLSRAAVQTAVIWLKRRRLIEFEQESMTATPIYRVLTPWRRVKKK
jgi:DNA-binding GntR family transcriptional regulator